MSVAIIAHPGSELHPGRKVQSIGWGPHRTAAGFRWHRNSLCPVLRPGAFAHPQRHRAKDDGGRETSRLVVNLGKRYQGKGLDLARSDFKEGTIGLCGPLKKIMIPTRWSSLQHLCLLVDRQGLNRALSTRAEPSDSVNVNEEASRGLRRPGRRLMQANGNLPSHDQLARQLTLPAGPARRFTWPCELRTVTSPAGGGKRKATLPELLDDVPAPQPVHLVEQAKSGRQRRCLGSWLDARSQRASNGRRWCCCATTRSGATSVRTLAEVAEQLGWQPRVWAARWCSGPCARLRRIGLQVAWGGSSQGMITTVAG